MKDKISLPLLASVSALTPLAVDMYLPAIPVIAEDLGVEISVIQNSLSIFLMGFGLGLLFFGPFSDRFGRRPLAILGLFGVVFSGFVISISTSATMFLTFRLLQGFLGGAASVVIPAMIRDCYGKDTAKGMSAVSMIMLIAPLVAPLVGSFLLTLGNWRTIFQFLSAYGLIVLVITLWRMPETKPEDDPGVVRTFFSNYKIILANHNIYFDLMCFMFTAFAFFTYLTSASFIYITYFGVSEIQFGFLFASTAGSLILANFINIRVVNRFGPRKMMHISIGVGTFAAFALVLVNSLGFGVFWSLACFIFIIGSLGVASINADSLILIQFPNQASSASAVTGTLRFGTGALAGPVLAIIYDGTLIPIAIMISLTFIATALAQFMQSKIID